ncbi:MAG TPA: lipid IV(A) 3-deoxy-D-manno-octulosonic acid transferase, partial [Steroidobacteraceae bacterium]|nr:lipid IV(A) 3-deoxy-D-manno-octulosonic acid transferase [Steroidobacteraceae bacterium]
MRLLYTLVLTLALPFASLVVWGRGLRERSYWHGWSERFGRGAPLPGAAPGLWVHAVSVGEVQAAASLVAALRHTWPELPVVVTSATPSGRARARAVFDANVQVSYAPYDLPWCVRAALRRFRPAQLILMETELWPNLLQICTEQAVPVLIASARLSERSALRWKRFASLLQPALVRNVTVAAQSAADAQRFEALGVPAAKVHICGNLKFDRATAPAVRLNGEALRARFASARPLWVAGSTHPGEELAALDAHAALRAALGDALLVIAPRHRPRFDEVASLLERQGEAWMRFSAASSADATAAAGLSVLLLDTLGELEHFYAAADLAFVGGSLVPVGGHNLLEPAALGVATLTGPHQQNSPDIARLLIEQRALLVVRNAPELATGVIRLMGNGAERAAMGAAARATLAENRGALARVLKLV